MKENNKKTTKQSTAKKRIHARAFNYVKELQFEKEIFRNSILATSLLFNLFFFAGWVLILVSPDAAREIGQAIYNI